MAQEGLDYETLTKLIDMKKYSPKDYKEFLKNVKEVVKDFYTIYIEVAKEVADTIGD